MEDKTNFEVTEYEPSINEPLIKKEWLRSPGETTPEPPKKPTRNPKQDKQLNLFLVSTIDNALMLVINKGLLKEEQITEKEIKESNFSESLIKTIDYYFPEGVINHPAAALILSSSALFALVVSKKAKEVKKNVKREISGAADSVDKPANAAEIRTN